MCAAVATVCVAACGLDLVVAILVSRPVCFSWVVDVGAACATLVSLWTLLSACCARQRQKGAAALVSCTLMHGPTILYPFVRLHCGEPQQCRADCIRRRSGAPKAHSGAIPAAYSNGSAERCPAWLTTPRLEG